MGNIDKIIGLKCYNKGASQITIATVLLIFYMLIFNTSALNLYSGQLKDFILENRYMQHIVGYITMLLIVVLVGDVHNNYKALLYTFIGYSWFLLTTKLDLQWGLAIIGLLVIGFLYEQHMYNRELECNTDQALKKKHRKQVRHRSKNMKKIIIFSIITVTIIGSILYLNKKRVQYGGDFDINKFIFSAKNIEFINN